MTNTLDLALVMRSLRNIGLSAEAANAAYGNYTALALPLFNLPIIFITPISNTVVPYVAGSLSARRDKDTLFAISSALRTCALIAFPCAFGLCALSGPILKLLFDDALALAAAPLLEALSPSVIFLSLATVTGAILQALSRPIVPVVSMIIGALVKALCCPIFIKIFSIKGAPYSTLVCYFTVSAINFVFLAITLRKRPNFFAILLKPLACALASSFLCKLIYVTLARGIGNALACLVSIAVTVIAYALLILLAGYITEQEIRMLPMGSRLLKMLGGIKKTKTKGQEKNERDRNAEIKKRAPHR
jgi:stage V sporulation protein B